MSHAAPDPNAEGGEGSGIQVANATPGGEQPDDNDSYESPKTYIEIEGLEPDDFDDGDLDSLEIMLLNVLLGDLGYPVEQVRFIEGDFAAVEFDDE